MDFAKVGQIVEAVVTVAEDAYSFRFEDDQIMLLHLDLFRIAENLLRSDNINFQTIGGKIFDGKHNKPAIRDALKKWRKSSDFLQFFLSTSWNSQIWQQLGPVFSVLVTTLEEAEAVLDKLAELPSENRAPVLEALRNFFVDASETQFVEFAEKLGSKPPRFAELPGFLASGIHWPRESRRIVVFRAFLNWAKQGCDIESATAKFADSMSYRVDSELIDAVAAHLGEKPVQKFIFSLLKKIVPKCGLSKESSESLFAKLLEVGPSAGEPDRECYLNLLGSCTKNLRDPEKFLDGIFGKGIDDCLWDYLSELCRTADMDAIRAISRRIGDIELPEPSVSLVKALLSVMLQFFRYVQRQIDFTTLDLLIKLFLEKDGVIEDECQRALLEIATSEKKQSYICDRYLSAFRKSSTIQKKSKLFDNIDGEA
jgi:hypothetical protein